MSITYKIKRIGHSRLNGITAVASASMSAVLKFDSEESPFCVYNELVAQKLAQTLHIPIATGVLTMTGDGHAYASLEAGMPGVPLPDVLRSQLDQVAKSYPDEAAALVAFDIFIGNTDRSQNLKASLVSPHLRFFAGFDHSHALLCLNDNPDTSIQMLSSKQRLVRFHPFFGRIDKALLRGWLVRIGRLDADLIRECCLLGKPFRNVGTALQENLANALILRKKRLTRMVGREIDRLCRP